MAHWARPLALFLLAAVLFYPLEARKGRSRTDERQSQRTDVLFATVGALLTHALLALVLAGTLETLATVSGIAPLPPAWHVLSIPLGLVLFELGGYAYHRAAHHIAWLWRIHSVHHTSQRLDWLASFRQHPLDVFFMSAAQNLPLVLLGIPLSVHIGLVLALKLNTVFLHSRIELPKGPWNTFIATPTFHRRHHALDLDDGNYASLFPWIDILFRSFRRERATAFGLDSGREDGFIALLLRPFWIDSSTTPAVESVVSVANGVSAANVVTADALDS